MIRSLSLLLHFYQIKMILLHYYCLCCAILAYNSNTFSIKLYIHCLNIMLLFYHLLPLDVYMLQITCFPVNFLYKTLYSLFEHHVAILSFITFGNMLQITCFPVIFIFFFNFFGVQNFWRCPSQIMFGFLVWF